MNPLLNFQYVIKNTIRRSNRPYKNCYSIFSASSGVNPQHSTTKPTFLPDISCVKGFIKK